MDETLNKLISSVFGAQLWHSTSLLEKIGVNSALGTMILIGYGFAALMLIFQLVMMVLNISKTNLIWENVGPLIFRVIIISALMSAPLYTLIFRYTISETTNLMANAIFSSYAKDFLVSWKSLFAGSGSSPSTPWAIILASFSTSLISNILSSVIFLAAVVCVFIVTMLQPFLWLFTYYCGPICLAFAVCDMTVHIARNWLNMFLIVNFVGIFGSISFVVAQAAGLVSDFGVGTSGNNIILVAVYGTMSIVFFCLIWPITGYIFSGYSPVGNVATPQGAIGAAATGAIAYGAVMAGTGSLLSKHGGDNSILGKIGDGLKSHGTAIMNNASNTSRVMKGWAPQREGSQSRGSQQQSSSIPLNQSNTTEKQPSNTAK